LLPASFHGAGVEWRTAIERHDPAVELNGRIQMRDHEEVTLVL
jgi:hypothetical protein